MKNLFFMCLPNFISWKFKDSPTCVLIYLFVFSLLILCFVIRRSWSFPMFNIYLFNNLFWANQNPKTKKRKWKKPLSKMSFALLIKFVEGGNCLSFWLPIYVTYNFYFCSRKFVKYFGETVIRILKLLSKYFKDPISSGETARKFVNMLLPFLAKWVKDWGKSTL